MTQTLDDYVFPSLPESIRDQTVRERREYFDGRAKAARKAAKNEAGEGWVSLERFTMSPTKINRGEYPSFAPAGAYQARQVDGVLYVRYVGAEGAKG